MTMQVKINEVINDHQKLNYRIKEMEEKYGVDEIFEVTSNVCLGDLEDHAHQINFALDEFEEKDAA